MENNLNPSGPVVQVPPTPPGPPVPPEGSAPRVIDLSANNQAPKSESLFHRKSFLLGILGVVLLTVVGVGVSWYAVQQRTTTPPQAAGDCFKVNETTTSNARGSTATETISVTNKCATDRSILFHVENFWCPDVTMATGQNYIVCQKNGRSFLTPLMTLHPGQTSAPQTISQEIANNGTCGSAQVDIFYRPKDGADVGPYFSTAWQDACPTTTKPLVCKSVTLAGGGASVTKGGETRILTAQSQGGESPVTFTWTKAADSGDTGTLSSDKGKTVTWTAPATLTTAQTWTITGTATESKGKSDSSGCVQKLTFTPTATFTYKTCENNACTTKACSPATTNCSADSTCTTDSDCVPATHLECVSQACKSVTGAGEDKCKVDGDCAPATHKECRNSSCQSVSGAGSDSCNNDSDCAAATHKECRNSACQSVSGSGSDSCNMDSDCAASQPQTHRACQNNSCVTVAGAGSDSCTSDVSCQPAATPPPIPKSGNELFTIGGLVLGAGSLLVGLLLIL